jgi:hypothetical protein
MRSVNDAEKRHWSRLSLRSAGMTVKESYSRSISIGISGTSAGGMG